MQPDAVSRPSRLQLPADQLRKAIRDSLQRLSDHKLIEAQAVLLEIIFPDPEDG